MKRITKLLVLVLIFTITSVNALAKEQMYSPYGSLIRVDDDQISNYKAMGYVPWQDGSKIITVYAPDGRISTVYYEDLQSYREAGWFDHPVDSNTAITIYAPNGSTSTIKYSQLHDYEAVGWYAYPIETMYAPDGRSVVVNGSEVYKWESVGWYCNNTPVTIYAPDGRTSTIKHSQLSSYKSVGWYEYPVVTMYAPDGRSIVVNKSSVSTWENVGWFDGSKTTTIYAPDGRTATIPLGQLESYKAVGWYDYPVYSGYSSHNTVSYYPGTPLPTYESVTGSARIDSNYYSDKDIATYSYVLDADAVFSYIEYIKKLGWTLVDYEDNNESLYICLGKGNYLATIGCYASGNMRIAIGSY